MKNRKRRSPEVIDLLNLAIAELKTGPFAETLPKDQLPHPPQKSRCLILWPATPPLLQTYQETAPSLNQLPLGEAIVAKGCEYWLRLGDASQARIEWHKLSAGSRKHPLIIKLSLRIYRELGLPAPRL
jgi:hypothetical protein